MSVSLKEKMMQAKQIPVKYQVALQRYYFTIKQTSYPQKTDFLGDFDKVIALVLTSHTMIRSNH